MGNELSVAVPSLVQPVETHVAELGPSYHFITSLGSTRFLKVAKVLKRENELTEGQVVVKVLVVHDPSFSLRPYRDQLESIRDRLLQGPNGSPNCAPFHHILTAKVGNWNRLKESEKAGLIVREFGRWTLRERLSTRPFLQDVEKRWLAFQLLTALAQADSVGVSHGDIKADNLLVTGSHWLRLTDFAPFKPAFLPLDNPSDFIYFFDTSRKGHCCLAPERFRSHPPSSQSLLAQPSSASFLTHAMDVFSAGCVLVELFCEGTVAFRLGELLRYKDGKQPGRREAHLNTILSHVADDPDLVALIKDMLEVDAKQRPAAAKLLDQYRSSVFPESFYSFHWPFHLQFALLPLMSTEKRIIRLEAEETNLVEMMGREDGVLVLPQLTSILRGLRGVSGKRKALRLMSRFATRCSPQIVLDRILPYAVCLLSDPGSRVRTEAVSVVSGLLGGVGEVPGSDARVFPDYVLPRLAPLTADPSVIVRLTLATHLPALAHTALRYLESWREASSDPDVAGGRSENWEENRRRERARIGDVFQEMIVSLLCDADNGVRQTLVHSGLPKLCAFLGKGRASDLLLSHMITFLNDKRDWQMRATFFRCAPALGAYIGWQATLILKPLLQQGLRDVEEMVMESALGCLGSLARLQLLQKPALYELLADAVLFLAHPNPWLRSGAVNFVATLASNLSVADVHCKIVPVLSNYLAQPLIRLNNPAVLIRSLRAPIPRAVWDLVAGSRHMEDLLDFLSQKHFLRQLSPPTPHKGRRAMADLLADEDSPFSTSPDKERSMERGPEGELGMFYRKLRNQGLEESMEPRLYPFATTLLKMQKMRNSLRAEEPSSPREGSIPGSLDLGFLMVTRRHADLTFTLRKRSLVHAPAPGVPPALAQPNEEWESMFGNKESRPMSPELATPEEAAAPPPQSEEDEEDPLSKEISSAMGDLVLEEDAKPTVEVPEPELQTSLPGPVDTDSALDRVLIRSECGEGKRMRTRRWKCPSPSSRRASPAPWTPTLPWIASSSAPSAAKVRGCEPDGGSARARAPDEPPRPRGHRLCPGSRPHPLRVRRR